MDVRLILPIDRSEGGRIVKGEDQNRSENARQHHRAKTREPRDPSHSRRSFLRFIKARPR